MPLHDLLWLMLTFPPRHFLSIIGTTGPSPTMLMDYSFSPGGKTGRTSSQRLFFPFVSQLSLETLWSQLPVLCLTPAKNPFVYPSSLGFSEDPSRLPLTMEILEAIKERPTRFLPFPYISRASNYRRSPYFRPHRLSFPIPPPPRNRRSTVMAVPTLPPPPENQVSPTPVKPT